MTAKQWGVLAAVAVAIMVSATAFAADAPVDTGNYLLRQCREAIKIIDGKDGDIQDASYCFGFVRATYSALQMDASDFGVCPPSGGVTGEQGVRIVVKFLNEHPERLHEDAFVLAFVAMGQAFVCPPKKKGWKP